MHCYSCDGETLKPARLDDDLPARECPRCGGVHLDLLAYRAWREGRGEQREEPPAPRSGGVSLVKADDNRKALICQRCSGLMLKFRIEADVENFVDLCSRCDDVWLDGGEWELLKHLDLAGRLTEIMAEPWQRRIRTETTQRKQEDRLRQVLGDEDHDRLKEIERWITVHPQRSEMLRYLRTRLSF
jgi:Zn-finger nucleic acid-binding protein